MNKYIKVIPLGSSISRDVITGGIDIDYITIATTSNATDFGDLTSTRILSTKQLRTRYLKRNTKLGKILYNEEA